MRIYTELWILSTWFNISLLLVYPRVSSVYTRVSSCIADLLVNHLLFHINN